MKKILFSLIILVLITGCGVKNNEKNSSNEEIKTSKVEKVLKENRMQKFNWNCDVSLNEIKEVDWSSRLFITTNNELYSLLFEDKLYSNNQICKKIETELKFERFVNSALITTNNEIYAYIQSENKIINEEDILYNGFVGGFDYSIFHADKNIYYAGYDSSEMGGGNKMYYKVNNNNVSLFYELNKDDLNVYNFENNEIFLNGSNEILQTDKAFYTYGITNKKECQKYADVKCEYGLIKDNISEIYSDIYLYNKYFIILKNNDNYEVYVSGRINGNE